MDRSKRNANRGRQREEVPGVANWSEICPDLLRCVFKRLSFTSFNRAKSVCSSWHSASRGCVPNQNQIPWLILFPPNEEAINNNNSSCVLFVPEDQDKVYRSRDLGVDFAQSRCLTTCGSWLLLLNPLMHLYIINPLTAEKIDLPDTQSFSLGCLQYDQACFRIDNKTKDYGPKGDNKWHDLPPFEFYEDFVYNHKDQKLYLHNDLVDIWDLSGDNLQDDELYWEKLRNFKTRIAVTVSGDILMVSSIVQHCKTWYFRIYKTNQVGGKWVKIDSLGDEALIYDMGITVIANGIPGIKRNSIYFSGVDHGEKDPHHIFVYDLTTQKMQPLPQCVFSSLPFSDARWFFP
ncbi:PREDICTED: F-box protein At2g05970-like [Camelina sativa]|uniref:F-box protein At2g05970-like n=1 Tax=Camelina sativa TaxID=90675 RepID=A0ABM0WAA0_CAMSA|nr:PREDICTED: F-box protein At2g05970-like [Camelina sativa]